MTTIEVRGLRKRYGDVVALDGLDLSIAPGEVVGFLGPNGAGKTTTMRVLTGQLAPDDGSATVGGLDVVDDSLAVRRLVGYLPERAPLFDEMRVRDFLAFAHEARGLPRAERAAAIDRVADEVGIADVLRRPIGELSKGYRQRVGLAQALIHDPPVLILDEPTSGLDPNQIASIRALLERLGESKTVLLSSHILGEVEAVCSRVIIVANGRIVGEGTPAEIEARASGGARVRVEIEGDVTDLDSLPGVARVERDGEAWVLHTEPGADPRRAVFERCVAEGWVLLGMSRQAATLEEAFRTLTG
jgi:ABC-2 type transport system ATP-binding protein